VLAATTAAFDALKGQEKSAKRKQNRRSAPQPLSSSAPQLKSPAPQLLRSSA